MAAARTSWIRLGTIAAATAGLCWPAIWNRYPLLFPDAVAYVGEGPFVWKTLLMQPKSGFWGSRSEIYSAGIYLLHWGRILWPVVAVQALATAWVIWLVVRTFAVRKAEAVYLAVMVVLCVVSSVAWFVSQPMADAWGPLLYLGVFLIVFAGETLRTWERGLVLLFCIWSVATHSSHLLVTAGLWWLLVAGVAIGCRGAERRLRWRGVCEVAAVIMLAVGMQMAVHWRMYGEPSVAGKRLPFLTERVIYDGPGRAYLTQNCGHLGWTICRYVATLSPNEYAFLFDANGVWHRATRPEQEAMLKEEMPLVLASVREYPRWQMRRSWSNFKHEAADLSLNDLTDNLFARQHVGRAVSGGSTAYARTKQIQNALPLLFFGKLIRRTFWLAAGIALALPLLRNRRLTWLCLVAGAALVLNAAVTGVLACFDARLQTRVSWLAVLVAATGSAQLWQSANRDERSMQELGSGQ